MLDVQQYHWVWYLLGFMVAPRMTLMVIVSLHTNLPLWGKIGFWTLAVLGDMSSCKKYHVPRCKVDA